MSSRHTLRRCSWALLLGLDLAWIQPTPLTAQTTLPAIVINEILCDPANPANHDEFVELYNAGASSVNLTGWTLEEAISYTFPQGTVVPAGGYLAVAEDPTGLRQKAGVACYGPFQGHLKTEGERITLCNASGATIDQVEYRLGFPWPTATQGRSMELINGQLDNDLGGSWRVYKYGSSLPQGIVLAATPGARNSIWAAKAPPQIRQIDHAPKQSMSNQSIVVTAKITDPDGVGTVALAYQVVRPGHYIPAWLPVPVETLKASPSTPRSRNPEFDAAANWSSLQMTDDGTGSDETASDGVFTAVIPGQPYRTLIRYRITASDASGSPLSITVPYQDDEALNFACWVYDGVPAYVANTSSVLGAPHTYDTASLETLPVYTLVTRAEDLTQCLAYDAADQIPGENVGARRAFNWEGAFVFEGRVYDHVNYRLRGATGRYDLAGKRDMKIHFNRGGEFQAKDRFGRAYTLGWRDLNVGKMFDDLASQADYGQGNFGLTETVNSILWNLMGVPTWDTHWFHFRVVDGEQEAPNQYQGDFWGLFLAMEEYDGRFLQRQGLADGNLYKLSASVTDKAQEKRNQGRDSVADTSDYTNLKAQLAPGKTEAQLRLWLDYDEFYGYLAVAEAVRHYDFPSVWSDENVAFYFEPDATGQNPYGLAWTMPYDTDLTWGPVANDGINEAWQALEPAGVDGKAHTENAGGLTAMKIQFRNTLREFRDLLWNPETINPLLDELAGSIADLAQADQDRWTNVPAWASGAGQHNKFTWSVQDKVEDMKRFAFIGDHTWSSTNASGYVPAGGQSAILDQIAGHEGDSAAVPNTPTATYIGPAEFPVDGLIFRASAFSDPQGTGTFGAMQWRIAEVSDVNALDYDPANRRYEIQAVWQSEEITPYVRDIAIPTTGLYVEHLYRVRVRMKDNTGRWSHWSAPVQFVTGPSVDTSLADGLRVTEVMVHPADPPAGEPDAEFIEFQNIGAATLNLAGVRISEAVDFTFGAVTLDPGQYTVVVKDRVVFESRYGAGLPIAGEFAGSLNNAGETITLIDALGQTLLWISYDPAWYTQTDGQGYSLVAYDPALSPGEAWSTPEAWQPSNFPGGSPGKDDFGDLPALGSIVINEVLAHSHSDAPDWIELYNTTTRPIALGGWFLSNSAKDLTRYQVPAGTVILAKGYLVFYENSSFGNTSAPGSREPFALSEEGDTVYLSSGHNGQLTGYSEYRTFGASETAVSFGLYTTSSGTSDFVSLSQLTPGAANAYPEVGPVVINEVMYNPTASNDAEYVELVNVSTTAVKFYEASTKLAWQFTDDPENPGITWTFAGTSDVVIGVGQFVLLVKDKTVFNTTYGSKVPAGTQIFEWTGGRLDNAGDKLDLAKLISIDDLTTGWVHVDRVNYSDGSHPAGSDPWPTGADGSGMALARIKSTDYGNDVANWKAAQASPGKVNP